MNEALIKLNMISGLGSLKIRQLLDKFENADNILKASKKDLCSAGSITAELADSIIAQRTEIDFDSELRLIEKKNVKVITYLDEDYPKNLKEIYDAPILLYCMGQFSKADELSVALVGSRKASFYGRSIAEKFAAQLAALGITVVSGLARGIDTASHKGAMGAKGRTIAVLGSGLNNLYPPENIKLAKEISEESVVVSEFPMNTAPLAFNFPRRNRIISGLSKGVVVVEAARKSGALITADCALEQGREVFAVPGKVDSSASHGTNRLIQQGAKLVQNVEDIVEELKLNLCLKPEDKNSGLSNLEEDEKDLLFLINSEPVNIDQLAVSSGKDLMRMSELLLKLQMKRLIKELPGKNYARMNNG